MSAKNGKQTIDTFCPYEELYIYLVQGLVTKNDEAAFDDAFIGNWIEDESSFLFFSRPAKDNVTKLIQSRTDLTLADNFRFAYEDWQGGGLDTLRVDRFVICPPWAKHSSETGLIQIILDPGVVFGNGLHPTTRDCLRALSHVSKEKKLERVLDLGTGSGILALAAAKVSSSRVLTVDLNPLCVRTAVRNVTLNGLEKLVQVVQGRAEDFMSEPADLVIANIHHDVIVNLFKSGGFQDKAYLILSGLMRSQAADIKARLKQHKITLLREWDHEMTWFTMLVQGSPQSGTFNKIGNPGLKKRFFNC